MPLAPLRHRANPSLARYPQPCPTSSLRNTGFHQEWSVKHRLLGTNGMRKRKKKTKKPQKPPYLEKFCDAICCERCYLKTKGRKKGKKDWHLFWKYCRSSSNGTKFWRCCGEFWSMRWHLPLEDILSSCCKLTKNILLSTDFTQGIMKLIQCVCALRSINWLFNLNQLLVNISYWNKRKLEQWLLPPTLLRFNP